MECVESLGCGNSFRPRSPGRTPVPKALWDSPQSHPRVYLRGLFRLAPSPALVSAVPSVIGRSGAYLIGRNWANTASKARIATSFLRCWSELSANCLQSAPAKPDPRRPFWQLTTRWAGPRQVCQSAAGTDLLRLLVCKPGAEAGSGNATGGVATLADVGTSEFSRVGNRHRTGRRHTAGGRDIGHCGCQYFRTR